MRKQVFSKTTIVLALLIMTAGMTHAGPKWDIADDTWMQLSFLGQPHFSYNEDAIDQEDFYLRRGRFILSGQIQDGVKFFVETDNDNAGKNGASDSSTDIQDVFVDLRLGKSDHWIEVGLILLPFSFETKASAASLLGIDYNTEVIKLANTFVWRDYGAELHGNFGKMFAYRVGAFDGYDTATSSKNPGAELRYTGHIAMNLIGDVETGWFYGQSRLSNKNYLSVGAGVDSQKSASLKTITPADPVTGTPAVSSIEDNDAWVIDFQSGFKMGCTDLTINGAYYDWDNTVFKGNTAFVETGVLYGKTMLSGKYTTVDSDSATATTDDYTAGLHYFPKGHNLRGGIEYRWGDSSDWILLGLQFLL